MSNTFDRSILASLVLAYLDVDPASLRFRPLRTGKHNTSFWVDSARGRYVLRLAPPDDAGYLFYERLMMRQEPDLHALLRTQTRIPVAEVTGYDFSRTRIDRDYMLLAGLPGTPLSELLELEPQDRGRALRQVGEQLRSLHALTADRCLGRRAFGYLGAHHPMEPQPSWAAAFRVMWNLLLDDVVACGAYTPQEAGPLRDLYDIYAELFDRPVDPRLLHMDIWSQNILVDGQGNLTGLVDFDRALWGDVEIEFAVLDFCGISEPAFWEGYGTARDDSPAARVCRQFYLLYELQKYMPIETWRRKDPRAAARYRQSCLSLAAQLVPR